MTGHQTSLCRSRHATRTCAQNKGGSGTCPERRASLRAVDAEEVALRRRAVRRDGVAGVAVLRGTHLARYAAQVCARQAVGHGVPLQRRLVGGGLLAVRIAGRLQTPRRQAHVRRW